MGRQSGRRCSYGAPSASTRSKCCALPRRAGCADAAACNRQHTRSGTCREREARACACGGARVACTQQTPVASASGRARCATRRAEFVTRDVVASWLQANQQHADNDARAQRYGTVKTAFVFAMIDRLAIRAGQRFVDVGSGAGLVCFLVALVTGANVCGIEIDAARHRVALLIAGKSRKICQQRRWRDVGK